MPGPLVQKPGLFPEWVKPENASVFDPVYRAPLRTIIGWLGLDDPQQVMSLGVSLESGAMGGGALDAVAKRFPRLIKAIKTVLPMDDASRLQRAEQLGFDTSETLYHGSNKRFTTFETQPTIRQGPSGDLLPTTPQAHFLTTEPQTARYFAKQRAYMQGELQGKATGTPSVRKFYVRVENPLDLTISDATRNQMLKDGYSPHYNPDALNPYTAQELENLTGYNFEDWNDVARALDDPDVISALRDVGYDGVRMREVSFAGDTVAVFDPNQIRSTKAAFDPKKAKSGNILYGFLPVAGAGGAAASQQPGDQR